MGKRNSRLLAQSSMDLLLLLGIVMIVFIPLFYYSNENVDIVRESQIAEGMLAVKNAIGTLIEIGVKSRITEIITNPSGITGYNITGNLLNVYFKNQNVSAYFQLPIFDRSRWPTTQGIHRINIFNEGDYIIFTECGNGEIEAYEQCDGTAGDCLSGTCVAPGNKNECTCTCVGFGNTPCPLGYACDNGFCQPMGCDLGYVWILGKCCPDLDDDDYYGTNSICPPPIDCDDNNPAVPDFSPGAEVALGGANACSNSVDDDCDGDVDCDDTDCASAASCIPVPACGDGTPDYTTEECDDGNTMTGDGCNSNCEIELGWIIFPNPSWINQQVLHRLKNIVSVYIRDYAAANPPLTNIVKICDQAGCALGGSCQNTEICAINTNVINSCPETTPSIAGNYDRWACIWSKATKGVMNVMAPGAGLCGNGILNPGEQCESCVIDSDCDNSMCIGGVCAYDLPTATSQCEYNSGISQALLNRPTRGDADTSGDMYIADISNQRVRKVFSNGIAVTLAGGATGGGTCGGLASTTCNDGPADQAQFNFPIDAAFSSTGYVYVADRSNHRIRVINTNLPRTDANFVTTLAGSISGFADGSSTTAKFSSPNGIVYDETTQMLYVADTSNHRIRKINLNLAPSDPNFVTTLAGSVQGYLDGPASTAKFSSPSGLTLYIFGGTSYIYLADRGNDRIRRVVSTTGTTITIAGGATTGGACAGVASTTCNDGSGGPAGTSQFNNLEDIEYDGGSYFYIADTDNNRIRVLDLNFLTSDPNFVKTVAGSSGFGAGNGGFVNGDALTVAELSGPTGVISPNAGTLYIVDKGNHAVRKLDVSASYISTLTGTGTAGFKDDHLPYTCGLNLGPNPCECALCGNGVIEGSEQCDDGNTASGDGCSSTCTVEGGAPYCGDGVCDAGESCSSCTADCGCPIGQVCNAGTCQPPGIGTSCTQPGCGPGQECGYDGCGNSCGICDPGEICNGYYCTGVGGQHFCGNGVIEPPWEECEQDIDCGPDEQCDNCQCIPDTGGLGQP